MQRETPSGECLQWELLFAGGHSFGNLLPFFIDWQECIHPGRSSPAGGELVGLEISTPDADRLRMLLVDAEPRISIRSARIPGLAARVQVADRIVTLKSSSATSGLRM